MTQEMVQLVSGILALVLVAIIILRRKAKAKRSRKKSFSRGSQPAGLRNPVPAAGGSGKRGDM